MDASTALLILAAIVPYLIWLIKFIMKQANSHVHHGNVTNEELSKDDSSASSSDPASCPPYPLTTTNDNREELSMFESDASSSGGQSPSTKYDVFLSFRGEDTRDNFTSHLHQALRDAGINTYIDYRLNKGEIIGPSLEKAIQDSHIYVIIFSENYASSTWCLDELVKIIECKDRDDARIILPVFYHIEPSNVRKQSGTYADAFLKHERRFKDSKDKVQRWRDALSQIPNLCGWHSDNIRPESELVKEVVKNISKQLIWISSYEFEGLVGIGKHVKEMEKRLSIGFPDIRIVGICGMGGIGKTTIAEVVFHKLKAQFESYSFVAKVREQIEKKRLKQVQKECLSELLKDEGFDIYSLRSTSVKNRLRRKKILLVLDDVDNSIQVDDLIEASHWLGLGSRIIITSRDKHVIKKAGAKDEETYHVSGMDNYNALQLFSLKAFKKFPPPKDYLKLSEKVINYCKGFPLALIILGSFLFKRSVKHWENALEKLEKALHGDIFNVLKISFDGLDNPQKDIFLDLSCFFSKSEGNMPKRSDMRNYYEPSADLDIEVLIERSLISVDACGRIVMHDLLVAMGQEISSQLLANNPDKPIRLWKHEDVYCALTEDMGTKAIRSISMDISTEMICLQPTTFQKMYRLRYLEFYKSGPSKLHVPVDLQNLPKELRLLHWDEYPLPSLPSYPKNLVKLNVRDSHLKCLWDGTLKLPNLKKINLSGSKNLIELPDLSQTNIEDLNLDSCVSLVRVHSSSPPAKLRFLSWFKCPLQSLPPGILSKNLVELWLISCDLEYLWDEDQHLPNLRKVFLRSSKKLIALPDLYQAPNIAMLELSYCPNLVQVYSSSFLCKLQRLTVDMCPKLRSLQLPRYIRRRCSVLLAVYYYFDIRNFSFLKVTVSLFECNERNTPVLRFKAVQLSFTDGVSNDELRVLGETLASSLPNLKRLGWLQIPSSIGQFSQQFEVLLRLQDYFGRPSLELRRKSSKNLNPEKGQQSKKYPRFPCMEGMTVKEASSPLEQLMGLENSITESDFGDFNRLLKVPNNTGLRLSVITKLSLQRSDIVSVHASNPGLSSLISLASLCDCKSHRTILDVSIVQTSETEGFWVWCGDERNVMAFGLLAGPTSMKTAIDFNSKR